MFHELQHDEKEKTTPMKSENNQPVKVRKIRKTEEKPEFAFYVAKVGFAEKEDETIKKIKHFPIFDKDDCFDMREKAIAFIKEELKNASKIAKDYVAEGYNESISFELKLYYKEDEWEMRSYEVFDSEVWSAEEHIKFWDREFTVLSDQDYDPPFMTFYSYYDEEKESTILSHTDERKTYEPPTYVVINTTEHYTNLFSNI